RGSCGWSLTVTSSGPPASALSSTWSVTGWPRNARCSRAASHLRLGPGAGERKRVGERGGRGQLFLGGGRPVVPGSSVSEGDVAGRGREAALEQLARFVDGQRLAVVEALRFLATVGAQHAQLLLGFDAFRAGDDAEAVAEAEHRANDGGRVVIVFEIADERPIDLDLVEREAAQAAERRISGAEIVHRDPYAERLQILQGGKVRLDVAQQQRLGDLDLQAIG